MSLVDTIELLYGPPLDVISNCLRGCITAAPGHDLLVADFSAIEARGIAWLAGEERVLDVFRTGADIYCHAASDIYGRPISKKSDPDERQIGKVVVLACGYQGSVGAFQAMARGYGVKVPDTRVKEIVGAWREANPAIVGYWTDVERAAIAAVEARGHVFTAGPLGREVKFLQRGSFLFCRLPSGRALSYPYPKLLPYIWIRRTTPPVEEGGDPVVEQRRVPDRDLARWRARGWKQNGEPSAALHYKYVDATTRSWTEGPTYGGSLVENCLAADTEVLTDRGWIPITAVTVADKLWDGADWVRHWGLAKKGEQETLSLSGIRMTPDHRVLTEEGWRRASSCEGHHRASVRLPNSGAVSGLGRSPVDVGDPVRLRHNAEHHSERLPEGQDGVVRMSGGRGADDARHVEAPGLRSVALDDRSLPPEDPQGVPALRRPGNHGLPAVVPVRELLERHGPELRAGTDARSSAEYGGLQPRELRLAGQDGAGPEHASQPHHPDLLRGHDGGGGLGDLRAELHDAPLSAGSRLAGEPLVHSSGRHEPVFDLVDAGPRNRFVVRPAGGGTPLIVHNCTQAICRDLLAGAIVRLEARGYPIVMHVHDEVVSEVPEDYGDLAEFNTLVAEAPTWAAGFPIEADGWRGKRYRK